MNRDSLKGKLEAALERFDQGFESAASCQDWAARTAPLLKFNNEYHYSFTRSAQIIGIEALSSQTIKPHLNNMRSNVLQAIVELENYPAHENTQNSSNNQTTKSDLHTKPDPSSKSSKESYLHKLIRFIFIPLAVTIVAGVALLIIENRYFKAPTIVERDVSSNQTDASLPPNVDTNDISRSEYLLQTGRTYDLDDGNLTISLTSAIPFQNSSIDLVVSSPGMPQVSFDNLSQGEKVFFEKYEILFKETDRNIVTYDAWIRVRKL